MKDEVVRDALAWQSIFAALQLRRTRSRSLAMLWSAGIARIFQRVRRRIALGRIDSRSTR